MLLSNAPSKLLRPFADAGGRNTIPVASQVGVTPGAASLTDGFPPLTRTPVSAGGVPPSGQDMNGVLYELSAITRWANAGGGYPFDGTFAADTNVGGYPTGARILRADGQGYWFNTVDGNTTDPETSGAAAAGWVPDFQAGAAAVTMTSANVTLTPAQYGKPLIVITGTLTSDLNLIFPAIIGQWVIFNGTTGNFSITCKPASGSGVAVPQGTADLIFCDGSALSSILAGIYGANGAALVGYTAPLSGAVRTTQNAVNSRKVHVFDFLTAAQKTDVISGGLSIDCSAAVQAAINAVCPIYGSGLSAGIVEADPRYPMLIAGQLDLSNSRTSGTRIRDGLSFLGFNLVGRTGSGYSVMDVTGSQWLKLEGSITANGTGASSVGIYQGVSSALPQTQNQTLHVRISMPDDPTANGGYGTIGIWNFGAEENTYPMAYIQANIPVVLTTQVASPIPAFAHPFQAQAASHSLGVTVFPGECFLVALNRRQPPVYLLGVNSLVFENTYIGNIGSGGANDDAFAVYSSCVNVRYSGTIEQLGTVHVYDTLLSSNFDVVFGAILNTGAPIIKLERGGAGVIATSDFKISNRDVSSQTRNLFSLIPLAANEVVSSYIQNSTFKTNLPVAHTGLQENLLWNPKTFGVAICGDQWSYEIGNGSHKISFNNFPIGATGVTTELFKVRMPTVVGVTSAGGVGITIQGLVGTVGAGDNSRASGMLRSVICISTSQTGAMAFGAATTTFGGVANANSGGNNITAVAVAATAAAVATDAAISLTPTITGGNGGSTSFTGTAEMNWSGWNSVAPAILLSGKSNP